MIGGSTYGKHGGGPTFAHYGGSTTFHAAASSRAAFGPRGSKASGGRVETNSLATRRFLHSLTFATGGSAGNRGSDGFSARASTGRATKGRWSGASTPWPATWSRAFETASAAESTGFRAATSSSTCRSKTRYATRDGEAWTSLAHIYGRNSSTWCGAGANKGGSCRTHNCCGGSGARGSTGATRGDGGSLSTLTRGGAKAAGSRGAYAFSSPTSFTRASKDGASGR